MRGLIGELSEGVSEIFDRSNLAHFLRNFDEALCCLLLFRRIREVGWNASFAGPGLTGFGRYFPYNCHTGAVSTILGYAFETRDRYPYTSVPVRLSVPAASSILSEGVTMSSLANCQAEMFRTAHAEGERVASERRAEMARRFADEGVSSLPEFIAHSFTSNNRPALEIYLSLRNKLVNGLNVKTVPLFLRLLKLLPSGTSCVNNSGRCVTTMRL